MPTLQIIEIDGTAYTGLLAFIKCVYGASVRDVITEDTVMVCLCIILPCSSWHIVISIVLIVKRAFFCVLIALSDSWVCVFGQAVLELSERFGVLDIKFTCEALLCGQVDEENVLDLFRYADAFQCPYLLRR